VVLELGGGFWPLWGGLWFIWGGGGLERGCFWDVMDRGVLLDWEGAWEEEEGEGEEEGLACRFEQTTGERRSSSG